MSGKVKARLGRLALTFLIPMYFLLQIICGIIFIPVAVAMAAIDTIMVMPSVWVWTGNQEWYLLSMICAFVDGEKLTYYWGKKQGEWGDWYEM